MPSTASPSLQTHPGLVAAGANLGADTLKINMKENIQGSFPSLPSALLPQGDAKESFAWIPNVSTASAMGWD